MNPLNFTKLYALVFVTVFVAAVSLTALFTKRDIAGFKDNHRRIFISETSKAKAAIELFLEERKRLIRTFAIENSTLLTVLAADPENQVLRDEIDASLRRWFSSHFTFTIADGQGRDLLDDLEGFVGEICKTGIVAFSKKAETGLNDYLPFIHPQPHNYHFDLMAPWRDGDTLNGVFFVSFYPKLLENILRSYETPGHNLFLTYRARPGLIEITAHGTRDVISASRDIYLTDREKRDAIIELEVNGSLWNIIGTPDAGFFEAYSREKWESATLIIAAMLFLLAFAIWAGFRLEARRQKAHEELLAERETALKTEAKAAEKAKGEFLATMSHEIRTPLTGIVGFSDMLLDDDLSPDSRDKVFKVKDASRALLTIINDILDMSKIEAGKLEIEHIDFHLHNLIDSSVNLFRDKRAGSSAKPLPVFQHLSDDFPKGIKGDPTRLRQVLLNLIGNAVKFTEAGSVSLEGSVTTGEDGRPYLLIRVTDTGIGIKRETLDDLFSAFTQADATITRRFEGTGLGLSICKRLVELMGGEIGAESVFGEGSTFWFTVPYVEPTGPLVDPAAEENGATSLVATRPLKILVAEDNKVNQQIVAAILGMFGHSANMVGNGREAIAAVQEGGYDLVLMDVRMPEMSGPDATQAIRRLDGDVSRIPIIALTADAMAEHIRSYLAAGMNAVVSKPIDKLKLAKTINEAVGEEIHAGGGAVAPTEDGAVAPIEDGGARPPDDAVQNAAVDDFLKQISAMAEGESPDFPDSTADGG